MLVADRSPPGTSSARRAAATASDPARDVEQTDPLNHAPFGSVPS